MTKVSGGKTLKGLEGSPPSTEPSSQPSGSLSSWALPGAGLADSRGSEEAPKANKYDFEFYFRSSLPYFSKCCILSIARRSIWERKECFECCKQPTEIIVLKIYFW